MKILITIIFCTIMASSCAQNPLKTQLENYMDAQANINNFAGTVLVTKNDSILLKKAYGLADYEWNISTTIDTKYSLASVSKQFTAIAILQLSEKNKLFLDDKLSKYYPTFPKGDKITIKMLLNHSSGLGMGHNYEELYSSNSTVSHDSIVNYIISKPLQYEPGTKSGYSNIGYNLLYLLIEKVSGKSYGTYLKENIFDKAKMKNSGASSNDAIVQKMAKTYYYGYPEQDKLIKSPYINWYYNLGHDGVYSTVEDLYLYNKHLFEDTTLLSEKSKKQMFTAYNDSDFGYGVMVNPFYNHNHHLIGHDGGYVGTMTSLNKFPDDGLFVTVLSNNESPSHYIAYALSAIVFDLPVELPYEHKEIQMNPDIYKEYVGKYEEVTILQRDNTLFYSDYNTPLVPESKTKFFRSDNNRTVEFVQNKKGETVKIVITRAGGVKETMNRN